MGSDSVHQIDLIERTQHVHRVLLTTKAIPKCHEAAPHFTTDTRPRIPRRRSERFPTQETVGVRPRMRVVFAEDELRDGSVAEEVFEYPKVPSELRPELFWSKREIVEIRQHQKEIAKHCRRSNPSLVKSILYLHGTALEHRRSGARMNEALAMQNLTESESRGLEHFVTSKICRHRLWAVQKLLAVQEQCRREKLDVDDAAALLRVWSLKVSSAPNMYAHNLALGDEREALSGNNDVDEFLHCWQELADRGGLQRPCAKATLAA